MFQRVAIIGLGLIGGSIGLALRKTRAAQQVTGYDAGRGVSDHARRAGVIDQSYRSLADVVKGAELVILATPVGALRSILQELAHVLTPGAVVTDVASTKVQVINWAEEFLPSSVAFVGGHPMAGKEVSGVDAADGALFQGRVYCLTPTARTRPDAVQRVSTLVELLGARLRFLEPAEHDGLVAAVSHLPFLASVALVDVITSSPSWDDAAILAANGFRDVSRLAAGSPTMYRDICFTNTEAITRWLDQYISSLQQLRSFIATHDQQIDKVFVRAQQARQQWQTTYEADEKNT